MNKIRLIINSIISIVLVCVLMISSTYSLFTTSDVDEELNVYETGNLNITYTISNDNVMISNPFPTTIEESIKITPYRITVTNNGTVPYQFDVILDTTTAIDQIDSQYIMTQVGKIEPKSLGSCVDNVIKENIILPADSSVDIDIRVFISDMIKNTEMNKSFSAKLKIDGIAVYDDHQEIDNRILIADLYEPLSNKIMNLYHDGSELTTVNIGGSSANPSVTQNSKQGLMLDNNEEYRYYGANPDNYVEFNGELWRIISVSNVKNDSNDLVGSMRVKMIRYESIGDYSFDSSDSSIYYGWGVNDWSKSDLMTELNTLYYNRTSGSCFTAYANSVSACDFSSIGFDDDSKELISESLWYLGGKYEEAGLYADDYYNFERGTTVYECSTNDGACPRATSWTGKVGLMYPSDYAYATDLGKCLVSGYNDGNDYRISNCTTNNWLYEGLGVSRFISPNSGTTSSTFVMSNLGHITYSHAHYAFSIRPVIYLKSDVVLTDGDGSKSNPYEIVFR